MANWDSLRTGRYERCKQCGKSFWLMKCKEGIRFFCSYECYVKWRKGKKAHPNTLIGLKKGVELRKSQKGKKWEQMFSNPKEAHKKDHLRKIKEWGNLDYREKQMKHRTPEIMNKVRAKVNPTKRKENLSKIARKYNKERTGKWK